MVATAVEEPAVALPVVEEWMTAETPSPVPCAEIRSAEKITERWDPRSDGTYDLTVKVEDHWRTQVVKVHVVNETPSFSLREWEESKGRTPQASRGPQAASSTASPSASSATALPSALSRTHRSVRTQTGNLSLEPWKHVDDDPFP